MKLSMIGLALVCSSVVVSCQKNDAEKRELKPVGTKTADQNQSGCGSECPIDVGESKGDSTKSAEEEKKSLSLEEEYVSQHYGSEVQVIQDALVSELVKLNEAYSGQELGTFKSYLDDKLLALKALNEEQLKVMAMIQSDFSAKSIDDKLIMLSNFEEWMPVSAIGVSGYTRANFDRFKAQA